MPAPAEVRSDSSSSDKGQAVPIASPRTGWRPRVYSVGALWGKAFACLWTRVLNDNLDILAGGVALFAILSFMPAIAATVAIYGVVADPVDIHAQVAPLAGVIPGDVMTVVTNQLTRAAAADDDSLGWTFALSLAIAMFSAMGGARAIIQALNLVNRRIDSRSYLRQTLPAFLLSLGGILSVIVSVGLVVLLPTVLHFARLDADTELLMTLGRWPALFVLVSSGLAVVYRYAPEENRSLIVPGAIFATALWMLGSMLLSLYVEHVANYSAYGAFGGVMVVVLWFYVSAFVVLLGAALNRELTVARLRIEVGEARAGSATDGDRPRERDNCQATEFAGATAPRAKADGQSGGGSLRPSS
jgi:membrane protein